nr:hypothetical protein [Synergistaceae bacterium]
MNNNYGFSDTAVTVLKERYMHVKPDGSHETIPEMFSRVANYLSEDKAQEYYQVMMSRDFLPNSPTLMNAGRAGMAAQLSACYVLPIHDSMDSITDAIKYQMIIHKYGGGTGFNFSELRPKGAPVKSVNGKASGPVGFMELLDFCTETVMQGGARRGANMGILNVDHPDILEFISCKASDTKRLNNFNISVGMNDEFMSRVENKSLNKQEREIWNAIIDCAWKNGDPGLVFFDEMNRHNPTPELGKIEATNPCLRGNMKILTDKGYFSIEELAGKKVNIWNGFEWSEVEPRVTGHNQPMLRVTFSNGSVIDCTPYHKFILNDGRRVEAKDLKISEALTEFNLPVISCVNIDPQDLNYMWCAGFYAGDGSKRQMYSDKNTLTLYGKKKKLFEYCRPYAQSSHYSAYKDMIRMYMKNGYCWDKEFVPSVGYSVAERLAWLAGIIDADGARNSDDGAITITSVNLDFLARIKEMLNTLGVNATTAVMKEECDKYMPDGKGGQKLYHCKKSYRLTISAWNSKELQSLGLKTRRVNLECSPERNAGRKIKVLSIEQCENADTVYCLTEPKRHSMLVEGVLIGNCGEAGMLPFEACNLGSINLAHFITYNGQGEYFNGRGIDWPGLERVTCIAVEMLNDVIDKNHYPIPEVTEAVNLTRKIGLGVMGWADMLCKLGIKYGSPESLKLAEKVMSFIQKVGHKQSAGRNACVTCIAPTGTISLIAGCSSGVEPHFALEYDRIAFDKENRTILHYVNEDYEEAIVNHDERLDNNVFVTAHEINYLEHIDMQAAFQKYVDLAVSKTINLPNEATKQDVERAYLYAWIKNCKGITVYRDGSRDTQVLIAGEECPECGAKAVIYESGCKKCTQCGWSPCSV